MQRANVNGIALEYAERGSGEPVVFIHGGLFESFRPLAEESSLKDQFRLIRYARRGYGGSEKIAAVPMSRQAGDCLALMRFLDAEPAHVVGHSSGGVIAIQLARDAPEAVRSLTLLEPALLDVPSGPKLFEQIAPAIGMYQSGDKAGANDTFMQAVAGKDYRTTIDTAFPGTMEQMVADADGFWAGEFPALGEWAFTREDAARIGQPVLAVVGTDCLTHWPSIAEGHQRLLEWIPQAKPFTLPRANHLLHMQNPHDMAVARADFIASVKVSA
jgi:pimeloyl-ACP methyl ester carboxylesterase